MEMTVAIERLLRTWMREISISTVLPGGLIQGRLHLMSLLVRQLSSVPPENWFHAFPAQSQANTYFRTVVLPLQRELGWDDRDTKSCVDGQIRKMVELWVRVWLLTPGSQRRPVEQLIQFDDYSLDMEFQALRDEGNCYLSGTLRDDEVLYFAFVEDVETVPPGRNVYAASGLRVERARSKERQDHIRLGAIRVDHFLALSRMIDELDPENVGEEQRRRRRAQLNEGLNGVSLPVLDLFITPEASSMLRIAPAFGDWLLLGSTPTPDAEDILIYATDPEEGNDPTTLSAGLSLLARAPEFWENRLRDVFSLVHISDADFGEDERGDGNPTPIPPISPPREKANELVGDKPARTEDPPMMYQTAE